MKNTLCFLALLFLFSSLAAATWNVVLTDTYLGWEGGLLTVLVNGTPVLSNITLPSGTGPAYFSFTVFHGDQITTVYTPGSYAYENTYSFQNEAGVTVLTNGAGSLAPTSIVDPFMAAVLTPYTFQDGAGNNTGHLPIYPFYGYSYTQSIYLRAELPPSLNYRRISRLRYYWNGASVASHSIGWTVYLGHTSLNQFASTSDWVPLAQMTQVFSGNVHLLATPGWVEIVLDQPFEYDGTSNLVVAVDENTSLYDSSAGRFHQSLVGATRSLVYYNDSSNPDPAAPPTAMYNQNSIPNIIFVADPIIWKTQTESFARNSIPMGWTQYRDNIIGSNRWNISATNNAGGEPFEMRGFFTSHLDGVSRLISPPIKTSGAGNLTLVFKHYFEDWAPGITAKLQYSHDMNTWTDTGWSIASGGGNITGTVTEYVSGLSGDYTYLAWTLVGDHYQFNYWCVDDFYVILPPRDVQAQVIETEAVHNEIFTPKATVYNNSSSPATFYVTFTIYNVTYVSTQLVTDLAAYSSQLVEFAPYTPNHLHEMGPIRVTAHLIGDTNYANDQIAGNFISLDLDRQAFIYGFHTSNNALKGPYSFNLKTPGTITQLATQPAGTQFIAASDWIGKRWFGTEYDNGSLATDNFRWIDHSTGAYHLIGEMGTPIHGLAWDDFHGILYGTDAYSLYTLDANTGAATLVGSHGGGFLMIGLAYNPDNNVLYGIDLQNDILCAINTSTGVAAEVGPLGMDINFAQDLAFDRNLGYIMHAAYNNAAGLYWVNPATGAASRVGGFPPGYEMMGFAIPSGVAISDLRILPDRTLNWDPIPGVSEYKVYGSGDPYGPFTYLGSTPMTSWIEPGTPPARRFYHITAVYTRSAGTPEFVTRTEFKDPYTGELLDPQPELPPEFRLVPNQPITTEAPNPGPVGGSYQK